MANPTGKGGAKPGERRNPTGMSKEAYAERQRVNAVLLCETRDEKWLAAYDKALEDGLPPVILDYTYRRLGKPPEKIELEGGRTVGALTSLSLEDLVALARARDE